MKSHKRLSLSRYGQETKRAYASRLGGHNTLDHKLEDTGMAVCMYRALANLRTVTPLSHQAVLALGKLQAYGFSHS